jgi:DNA-binding MarR family transcriptional regulator
VSDPVERFIDSLWAAHCAFRALLNRLKVETGLGGLELMTMLVIERRPGISVGEISALLHRDPRAVAGVVRGLVRSGLIHAAQGATDKRRTRLALTDLARVTTRAVATRYSESARDRANVARGGESQNAGGRRRTADASAGDRRMT